MAESSLRQTPVTRLPITNLGRFLLAQSKPQQALTYLGHNQLKAKEYKAAFTTYQKVLKISPNSPSALYNQGLIARILKHVPEEKAGWLAYLKRYPTGGFAIKATGYLNQLGDFSYQNQDLGARTITLKKIRFQPFSDKLAPISSSSLNVVGATATNLNKGKLHVVVFQQNDKNLAKARAINIRKYLLDKFHGLTPEKIGISWFGSAEEIDINGIKTKNPESVRFFFTGLEQDLPVNKKKKKLSSIQFQPPQLYSAKQYVTISFVHRIEG